METTDRTTFERAEDFEAATWGVWRKLAALEGEIDEALHLGGSLDRDNDGTFEGTMPDGYHALGHYMQSLEGAQQAVNLAKNILEWLGD